MATWNTDSDYEGEIMKKQAQLIGKLFLSGIKTGSVIYLLLLAVGVQPSSPTAKNILSIMLMAGVIGIFSGLFSLDSLRLELPIHFMVTFLAVLAMMAFNGWVEWINPLFWVEFLIEFLIIYAVAWLIVFLSGNIKITRINKTLKERNQSQNKQ
ncbi:hypothetical protein FD08_GL001046 [Lentilactobacillus parakefiri DSM 10551]|nr:hypothetical protein FD08_GL001046 [Lentilactobacillus parakefiri DSM 10551]